MTPDDLDEVWANLPLPSSSSELEARELPSAAEVWLAVDRSRRPHLLVQVPAGTVLSDTSTHGMRVGVAGHEIPGRGPSHYIDLTCIADSVRAKFAVVAADIVRAVEGIAVPQRPAAVAAALSQWRWFWDVDPESLTASDAVGLFGELWFLTRWCGPNPDAVAAWEASQGARHDFQWSQWSVEVKTTAAAGPAVHRISPLSQLEDPDSGRLYLFSLRLQRDRLSRNTLTSLVEAASNALVAHPDVLSVFLSRLAVRGYSPASRGRALQGYRIGGEMLYEVSAGFPRLTTSALAPLLPTGVGGISYELDTSACGEWLRATAPKWPPTSV